MTETQRFHQAIREASVQLCEELKTAKGQQALKEAILRGEQDSLESREKRKVDPKTLQERITL